MARDLTEHTLGLAFNILEVFVSLFVCLLHIPNWLKYLENGRFVGIWKCLCSVFSALVKELLPMAFSLLPSNIILHVLTLISAISLVQEMSLMSPSRVRVDQKAPNLP